MEWKQQQTELSNFNSQKMTIKVKLKRDSRKGNSKLQAIVIVKVPDTITQDAISSMRDRIVEMKPNPHGILGIVAVEAVSIKVYLPR
jgi:hypothetical protein